MPRDFAMSFCEAYISAENGSLNLKLTEEEAGAMGIATKDYAEIVKSINAVNDSIVKCNTPAQSSDIRFVKDKYYWNVARTFKKGQEPELIQEAAFSVMNKFSIVENGQYALSITAAEAADKGISSVNYGEYCRLLERSNRNNTETGRPADAKFPFMAQPLKVTKIQTDTSARTLPKYKNLYSVTPIQEEINASNTSSIRIVRHPNTCTSRTDTYYHMKEVAFSIGLKYMRQNDGKIVFNMTPEQAEQLLIAPDHYAMMLDNVREANTASEQWGKAIDISPMINDTAKLDADIRHALELERFIRKENRVYKPEPEAFAFLQSKIQTIDGRLTLPLTLEEAHVQGVSPFVYEQVSHMIKDINERHPEGSTPQVIQLSDKPRP